MSNKEPYKPSKHVSDEDTEADNIPPESESDDDVRYRSLEEEQAEQQEAILDSAQHEDHPSHGYARDKEKTFDPVFHEKETEQVIEEEHEFYHGKKKSKHFEKQVKSSLLGRLFKRMSHLMDISIILDRETDKKRRPYKYKEEEIEKMAAYKHYVEQRPGDQAGVFDREEVAQEKGKGGKKTLSTFFEIDPAMDGMSLNKQVGLTMNMGEEVQSLRQETQQALSQGQNKQEQRLRERDIEIEKQIGRGAGRSR